MKFSSLYNNTTQLTCNTNTNKIRVNRDIPKLFSPLSDLRISHHKTNNKMKYSTINTMNKNKIKNTRKNNYINNNNNTFISTNYLKDVNYIRYININVDLNKIKQIQIWWKYIYKVIFLQKNIRSFITKKKAKQKLKYIHFISIIYKISFGSFFNIINICHLRFYFKKWKEIIDKDIIFNKILNKKKPKNQTQNGKEILNTKKSFQNNVSKDNLKKSVINTSTSLFQDKILSPNRGDNNPIKSMNIQINKKKSKNIPCIIYNREEYNSLNKSLNNKSTNKRSKSNNRIKSHRKNQSYYIDDKTQAITNNLYQNIKEYYNSSEMNLNPKGSTMNFYPKKSNKINNQKKLKKNIIIINNNSCKSRKKIIISNNKKYINEENINDFCKNNKNENYISYHHTFGNLKTNSINTNNYFNKNNRIIQSTFLSPVCNSIRNTKRNKNRSLEFEDNDIKSIKLLLKFKRTFIHWRNMIFKKKIIKKFRLISKIKNIINIYKLLHIKFFFEKINKKAFYNNSLNYNNILLNQYYNKLKEISKKKKILKDINVKYNNNNRRVKFNDKSFKISMNEYKNKKSNNFNYNTDSNNPNINNNTGLYYATQFNQKFSELLNNEKDSIIIINNNINNNCKQLINNIKQNKNKGNNNNNYTRKTINNSMIEIQPTDTSLSCTVDAINQSDKSLNSILKMNQMNLKYQNLIHTKKKKVCLKKIFKMINDKKRKKILYFFLKKWKIYIILKKCKKNKKIDEKIIHFPKSPSCNVNANYLNINNYNYNYTSNNSNYNTNNNNYTYNNNDLMIHTLPTDNTIKNAKYIYTNNNNINSNLLRNTMFTPSNKMSFYTQIPNNENNYGYNYTNEPPSAPRETEPKIVYHKKIFPSFCSSNIRNSTISNTFIIDYNYNKEDINNISFNNNNSKYNRITNFYSSNNFYNRRSNYHLEKVNSLLPEEKYGFKKINKIEEREISFSPTLQRKNYSFKNIINDNNYQNIDNNNNIFINVVENYQKQNINNLNTVKKINIYGNYYRPLNRSMAEEDNFNMNKLMCHSHSQGFTKTIQNIIGTS